MIAAQGMAEDLAVTADVATTSDLAFGLHTPRTLSTVRVEERVDVDLAHRDGVGQWTAACVVSIRIRMVTPKQLDVVMSSIFECVVWVGCVEARQVSRC